MNTNIQAKIKIFYVMTFFISLGLLVAVVLNILLLQQYKLAIIEGVFLTFLAYATYLAMVKNHLTKAAWITSLVLGMIILIGLLNGKGDRGSYSLILIFPLAVYQLLGRISATYLYFIFVATVTGITVYGINHWSLNIAYLFNSTVALVLGGLIAYYIEKTIQNSVDFIIHTSNTDSLTGLWNRKKSNEVIEQLNSTPLFIDSSYSIIIIDIDFFKNINDKHGHQVGDQVLVEFSRVIVKSFRKVDMTFRWGGEEFLVILPNTKIMEAEAIVDRFIKVTREHSFVNIDDQITVSAGVAQNYSSLNNEDLFKLADDALYESKHKGRDRYTLADVAS